MNVCLPLGNSEMVKYDPPSDEVLETYYQQIGVTEDTLTRDVATLRSWLQRQPHLPDNVG